MGGRPILLMLLSLFCSDLYSQQNERYFNDALRFSNQLQFGSARSIGFGNAGTAREFMPAMSFLNPATLGSFNSNELSLTLGFLSNTGKSSFNDSQNSFGNSDVLVNQVGVVFHIPTTKESSSPIRGQNLVISVNKTGDFTNALQYKGENELNGLSDFFIQETNGINALDLDADFSLLGLAWDNFLFDIDPNQCPSYDCDKYARLFPIKNLIQEGKTNRGGSQYQWDFNYALNLDEKFLLGVKAGFSSISYQEEVLFSEKEKERVEGNYSGSILNIERKIDGRGPNFGFGIVWKPSGIFNLGIGITSPTWFNLKETYRSELRTNFLGLVWKNPFDPSITDTLMNFSRSTRQSETEYKFTTPMRANVGLALNFGKGSSFSSDLEISPKSKMSYQFQSSGLDKNKTNFSDLLQTSVALRFGFESSFDWFLFRLGYQYFSDPTKNSMDLDFHQHIFSTGFGANFDKADLDLAITYSQNSFSAYPYQIDGEGLPRVDYLLKSIGIYLSGAIRF